MKYINKVTGAVIDTVCEISGGDWELVPEEKLAPEKKPRKAKAKE